MEKTAVNPLSFTSFGALLSYLRRREQLTQRDLGIAVGYSEGHINRFEKNKRLPPAPAAVAALFIPALALAYDSPLAQRLTELAAARHSNLDASAGDSSLDLERGMAPEAIPPAPPQEIRRPAVSAALEARLAADRHVVLSGLPGMGKTTLAGQITRQFASKMPVFWLTLTEGITASADVLMRELAFFLAAHGQIEVRPLIASRAGAPLQLPLDLKLALVCSALAKQPALLCIDNAELIHNDATCLQILRHIGCTTPVYLLIISRQSLPLPEFCELGLNGFEFAEGLDFVSRQPGPALDERQAERLVAKTDGSPMLLRLALGKLASEHAGAEQFIRHLETQPQVLAYLFETIQKQLSPAAWRLLLLLAAFDQPLNLYDPQLVELAQAAGEIEDFSAAIAELQRRQLILNAAYAQLHPLIVSYVGLALNVETALRQRLHRLAADWFWNSAQDALSAALHYNQAGLLDQAVDMVEENLVPLTDRGQAEAAVVILDEVQAKLERLRSAPPDLLRRLLAGRSMLLVGTLRVAEGEANLRQAIALTAPPAVRADMQLRLAQIRITRSDFQEALQLIQAARQALSPQDVLLRARLSSLEAEAYSSIGQREQCMRCATEALALVDQMAGIPQTLVGEIQGRAQMELASCARMQRDLISAMQHAQAALQSARVAQNKRMINLYLSFIGGLNYDLGDLAASFRYRNEGLQGLLSVGDVHSAAYLLTQLADIHYLWLEIGPALEKLDRACATLQAVSDMRGLAATESLRTSCLLWNGQVDEACRVIETLLKVAEGKGTERLWGYRMNKLAMVQLVSGELSAGIATLKQALDLPTAAANRMMRFELHNCLALAYAAAEDPAAALSHLAQAPLFEGLSRWAEIDRSLTEGFVALGRADLDQAQLTWQRLGPQAQTYPLYSQRARQLAQAIQQPASPSTFPRLMWVGATDPL